MEWSDRTTRILGSYREMRKAMGQVFGNIDERKTAAQKLQKLRQTNSVRNYITEFQTITANLDWDNETLADKFQEGLKQNIRSALIYFPTDLKNLEELFERAQKIDQPVQRRITTPKKEGVLRMNLEESRWMSQHSSKNFRNTPHRPTDQIAIKRLKLSTTMKWTPEQKTTQKQSIESRLGQGTALQTSRRPIRQITRTVETDKESPKVTK